MVFLHHKMGQVPQLVNIACLYHVWYSVDGGAWWDRCCFYVSGKGGSNQFFSEISLILVAN